MLSVVTALVLLTQQTPAAPSQSEMLADAVARAQSKGPLAPAAQAALDRFRGALAAVRRRHAVAGPAESVAGELARRVELEQAGRAQAQDALAAPGPDMDRASLLAWAELTALDLDNTAYLKRVLPKNGWFRKSRDGEQTAANAWLILQHSPDRAFMKQVVARMESLVRLGEVRGPDYALLYDRTEVSEGRPQRFGSQLGCIDGRVAFHPIVDPPGVDARRRAIGFSETLAQYAQRFPNIGQPCGAPGESLSSSAADASGAGTLRP